MTGSCPGREARAENPERKPGEETRGESRKRKSEERTERRQGRKQQRMSVIKAENLTFAYPESGENIFDSVSFQIDSDWKLGLIGRNGRGKTTFLRLLQGELAYTGRIISSVTFDYFPCPVSDMSRMTIEILEEICPSAEDWEFLKETSGLEIEPEALYRP